MIRQVYYRPFEGLKSTRVYVSVPQDMTSDGRPPVSQEFLQNAAETKLKKAGIKIIRDTNEAEAAGNATLHVWVKLSPLNAEAGAPPVGVESTFSQWVRLANDPEKQTDAATWKSQASVPFAKTDNGVPVITDEAVLKVVNRQLDEFIEAFKAGNARRLKPKKTAVPE